MAKASVLIIDDNEGDRFLLERYLERTGLDLCVFQVADGQEALDFLSDQEAKCSSDRTPSPLIAFLDVNMPIVNGWEFLERFFCIKNDNDVVLRVIMTFGIVETEENLKKLTEYDFVEGFILKKEINEVALASQIGGVLDSYYTTNF
jgi:CheY-like chemotaxis protein